MEFKLRLAWGIHISACVCVCVRPWGIVFLQDWVRLVLFCPLKLFTKLFWYAQLLAVHSINHLLCLERWIFFCLSLMLSYRFLCPHEDCFRPCVLLYLYLHESCDNYNICSSPQVSKISKIVAFKSSFIVEIVILVF